MVMRKCLPFLIILIILPLTASSTKDVPDLNEYPFVLDTRSANSMTVLKIYIAGEMWQNLKQVFLIRMHDIRTMKESYAT